MQEQDKNLSESIENLEVGVEPPKKISVCSTHTRFNWTEHRGYIDNHDGTASCMFCGWGTRLAGYYRVLDEHIVDLRTYGSADVSASA